MKNILNRIGICVIISSLLISTAGCGNSLMSGAGEKGVIQAQTEITHVNGQDALVIHSVENNAYPLDESGTKRTVGLESEERAVYVVPVKNDQVEISEKTAITGAMSHEGYSLEQVVVLSRHNIRSPMSGSGSILTDITPHKWYSWSSLPGELSIRGGANEVIMGQYFRKWLEAELLFPENYRPEDRAVRIYANSKQRTIATAKFFAAGLLPVAGVEIETHADFDQKDPVFNPQLTFINDAYVRDVEAQFEKLYANDITALEDNYRLLEDIIDIKESTAWNDGEVGALRTDDTRLDLKQNAEPNLFGSLKMAGRISDALVLQYYEEPDDEKAAFGHTLSQDQWKMVSEVKDIYQKILFGSPLLAPNVAHPLLEEIRDELLVPDRKFTFLSGHDSNVGSVLGALGADEYFLPGSIEKAVPIGSKLVFSKWKDLNEKEWISVNLVYQTAAQIRGMTLLDIDAPPAIVTITLEGLKQNTDGLIAVDDFLKRLDQAIEKYDEIKEKYECDR